MYSSQDHLVPIDARSREPSFANSESGLYHQGMNLDERLRAIASAQPYPLLFATVSGAHLYGFPSPDSDYDLRGAHILPAREVVGLDTGPETIEVSRDEDGLELDLVTHEVRKFFVLLLKKNGYVLEQLLSPLVVHTTPAHAELKSLAAGCVTRYHCHHYLGFAQTQWRLFDKERPRRVKPLLYVYRVLLTGIHLMRSGEVEANLVRLNERFRLPYLPELIARKVSGTERQFLEDADATFHQSEYERLRRELESAGPESQLPEQPSSRAALNDLLIRLRLG
jgi:predicted nucleotidyltransferase